MLGRRVADEATINCQFMDAGDIARNAMELVKHERDSRRFWESLSRNQRFDLIAALQSQLLRLLEHPEAWVPAVSTVRGERLDILISIPFSAFESRPLGDRLVTVERMKDDLVRVLGELRERAGEETDDDDEG